jgi:hypothetical protein
MNFRDRRKGVWEPPSSTPSIGERRLDASEGIRVFLDIERTQDVPHIPGKRSWAPYSHSHWEGWGFREWPFLRTAQNSAREPMRTQQQEPLDIWGQVILLEASCLIFPLQLFWDSSPSFLLLISSLFHLVWEHTLYDLYCFEFAKVLWWLILIGH